MKKERKPVKEYTHNELRNICQMTATRSRESIVGLFSRMFSIQVTKVLLRTKITPNQITVLSVFIYFAGIGLFAFNQYWYNLAGCALIFLSIVFDGCDGEVARFRQSGGKIGGLYVEPVSHDIQYGISFLIIAIFLFQAGTNPWILVVGAIAGITKLLYRLLRQNFWLAIYVKQTEQETIKKRDSYHKQSTAMKLFNWANKNLFSSTAVFLIFFIASLADRVDLAIWYFAIGYTVLWLLLFAKQIYKINKNNIK